MWCRRLPNRYRPHELVGILHFELCEIAPNGFLRASGVRDLLVYWANYKCSQGIRKSADRWPDHVQLSDLEPLFVCQACGRRGRRGQAGLGLGYAPPEADPACAKNRHPVVN
jgi:hypothetical protein